MNKDQYQEIEAKLERWPDFMEKEDIMRPTVQSESILGKVYRGVDCK